MDFKLEVIGVPVSDVDAAIAFYVDKVGFNLDHDIRPRAQLQRQGTAVVLREVQSAAPLPPVHRQVVGGLPAGERRPPRARLVAALRPLDLHDVGAEVGEHHRAVRPREHAGQVGDANAREGRRSGGAAG